MTNKQESCLTAVEKRVGRGRKFGVNRESLAVLQLIEIWAVAHLGLWQMQRCAIQNPSRKGLLSGCRQCGQKEPAAELLRGPPELPRPFPEQLVTRDRTK